jgi:hypothetical protein
MNTPRRTDKEGGGGGVGSPQKKKNKAKKRRSKRPPFVHVARKNTGLCSPAGIGLRDHKNE